MKKAAVLLSLFMVLVLWLAPALWAGSALERIQQKKELVVGMTGTQPPLNATTKEGKIIGLDADLAKLMAAGMGVKLKIETMDFADLLPALEAGKLDMVLSSMTMTPQRNTRVAFVGPYYVSGKGMLTKTEHIAAFQGSDGFNKPEFSVAALKDSTSQMFVEKAAPQAKLVPVASYDEALKMLFEDKIQALIADYPYCAVTAYRYEDKGITAGQSRLTFEPLGIALPEDVLLINWVQNTLAMLKGSGDLEKLTKRWFDNPTWIKDLPE